MTPEARRADLLDVGMRAFSSTSDFEALSMAEIAAQAGVTRRLMYHYFPTKAEFFGAIWEAAHSDLRHKVSTLTAPTVRDRISAALDAYLDFYDEHLALVMIANRSSISADPAVRGPIERDMHSLCNAFLDAAGAHGHARELGIVAFSGWTAFVRASSVGSIVDGRITRAENHQLCMSVIDAAVGTYVDLSRPPC